MLLPPARFCGDLPTAYRDCRQRKCFGWGWRGSSLHTFFFYPKVCLREEELQQFDPCYLLGVVLLSAFLEIQKTRVTQKSASGLKKKNVFTSFLLYLQRDFGVGIGISQYRRKSDFLTVHPFLTILFKEKRFFKRKKNVKEKQRVASVLQPSDKIWGERLVLILFSIWKIGR